jgi:hypothetical protein
MSLKKTFPTFLISMLVSLACVSCATVSDQYLVKGDQGNGSIDIRNSNLCLSTDGSAFRRRDGEACQKGDLTYVHVANAG